MLLKKRHKTHEVYYLNESSISCRLLPLVSGTKIATKRAPERATPVKSQYTPDRLIMREMEV